MRLTATGPYASVLRLDAPASPDTSRRLLDLRSRLAETAPPEVRDLVPGFTSVLVEHRPTLSAHARRAWLERASALPARTGRGRTRTVRVAYGVDADVAALEEALGLPFDRIATLHAEHRPTVAFVGFTPGFPYLFGLPTELHLPRRDRPLARIPAGAVAIAAGRGGIYPSASPGGWWVLGRTDARLFDPRRPDPVLLEAGDTVAFEPVPPDALEPDPPATEADVPAHETAGRVRVLESVPASASLQGRPRWGGGHLGLAQAGALDPLALNAANLMVGNAPDRLALEVLGQPITLRSDIELLAAVTGGGVTPALNGSEIRTWRAFTWPAGAELEVSPDGNAPGRTAILAVGGGFLGERWRGSDSTDLRAGAGGQTRWLRDDDVLAVGADPAHTPLPHPGRPRYPRRILLHLHPGPQYDPDVFERLATQAFRLEGMDRTGARLAGGHVTWTGGAIESDGSPWGAVQVPPDGRPIVLLADRGRTGGYPKPGVVDPRDLWRLAQARVGDEVWLLDARREEDAPDALDSSS